MVNVGWDVLYDRRVSGWSGGDEAISEWVINRGASLSHFQTAIVAAAGTLLPLIG